MYKALFLAIKKKLPHQEQIYKEIGNELQKILIIDTVRVFLKMILRRKLLLKTLKTLSRISSILSRFLIHLTFSKTQQKSLI